MTEVSLQALTGVSLSGVLVVMVQLITPSHSATRMGVSALARGRHGWLMKLAFAVRGMAALSLVAAVQADVPPASRSFTGMVLFTLWGAGSALLAAYDVDLPGERPTNGGRAHAVIAAASCLVAVAGMLLISWRLWEGEATAGLARWALPIALAAAVALTAEFTGLAAAAGSPRRRLGACAGLLQRVFLALVVAWSLAVAACL
jgi:hypothetical protein